MDQQAPLLALELLADRGKRPGALLLHAGGLPLPAERDALSGLAAATRVFFLPGGDADLLLRQAGCLPLPEDEAWLRGDWYLGPPARSTGAQAATRALALQLVQLVVADADNHEIEAVLRRDPALSYHLLRLVNSLGVGAGKKIASFGQAILILGRSQLRRWLNLMLFSSRDGDERAAMLMARAAARARLMELLARLSGMDKPDQDLAFMAGMFSLLGILFGMPLDALLKPLKISDTLSAALLHRQGGLGNLLRAAEHAGQADLAALPALLAQAGIGHGDFNLALLQACAWSLEVAGENKGADHG